MTHARRLLAALVGAALVCSIAGSSSSAGALTVPTVTTPSRPYAPHTLLVGIEPGVTDAARAALHAANGATVRSNLGFQDVDVVTLPPGLDPLAAAAVYQRSPLVDFAEPNYE